MYCVCPLNELLILNGLRAADVDGDVVGVATLHLDGVASVQDLQPSPAMSRVGRNLKIADDLVRCAGCPAARHQRDECLAVAIVCVAKVDVLHIRTLVGWAGVDGRVRSR